MRARLLAAALTLSSLALAACADQTALLVEVRSDDLVVPLDVNVLRFEASNAYGAMLDRSFAITGPWPHSITIVPPAGETAGPVTVRVTAYLGDELVTSTVLETTMQPGVTRRETVVLSRCVGAGCMTPDGGMPDAAMPGDAGMVDAGTTGMDDAATPPADAGQDAATLPTDAGPPDTGPRDSGGSTSPCTDATCIGRIVLSEVATGGPGGGTDEFVELYNTTSGPIDLGGVELRYASSSGSESARVTIPAGTVIPAHGFLLLAASGYTGSPAPDVAMRWTTGLAGTSGTVILRAGGSAILDRFGWGVGTSVSEGTPHPDTLSGSESYERKAQASSTATSMAAGGSDERAGNRHDTDVNASDWVVRAVREPQGAASATEP